MRELRGIPTGWTFRIADATRDAGRASPAIQWSDECRSAQIPPETPLPSCPERSVGLSLPVPINARIDLLVELAEQAGEQTSRKEIVATCILGAPDGADELVRWLRIYRRSPANSTATSGAKLEDVLELRPVRPGRRPRRWRHRSPPA